MVTLAATAAANLVATLEVGACGAVFVSRIRSAHSSLMAREWVVRLFTRQWRRIVLSRGIAFQLNTFASHYSTSAQMHHAFVVDRSRFARPEPMPRKP